MKQSDTTHKRILKEYWRYSKPYLRLHLIYIVSIPIVVACSIIVPYFLKDLVDLFVAPPHGIAKSVDQIYGEALTIIAFIAMALVAGVVIRSAGDFAICYINPFIFRDIENDCFQRMIRQSYRFFSDLHIGALISKVRRYVDGYEIVSFNLTRKIFPIVIQYILTLAIVATVSIGLALLLAVWGCLFIWVNRSLINWKMKFDKIRSAAESKTMAHLADTLSNFLTVKIFSRGPTEAIELNSVSTDAANKLKTSWQVSAIINIVEGSLMALIQVATLYMTIVLWRNGSITIGTIVMVQTYVTAICVMLTEIGVYSKAIYRSLAAAYEMSDMLACPVEVIDPVEPRPPAVTKGEITFDKVTFGYSVASPIFKEFSLSVKAGERVALVGASGAGKTTLVKLLLRFMDPQQGRILLDGQSIDSMTQDDLRQIITFVPQEPSLFHRSIFDNIAYGRLNVSLSEVIDAARKAYILDFIESLPNGFETMVGERGIKLSGGEKQRIAIARAMLRKSPILILDEATNSLDSVSEKYVQLAFNNLMEGCTTLVIAHRLATVRLMDRIIVLQGGEIVESGSHQELLDGLGHYFRFWSEGTL